MVVYCCDNIVGFDYVKMNFCGGVIVLGYFLGVIGVRQIVIGLSECRRIKKKMLLISMCIGIGQGMVGLFVNEQVQVKYDFRVGKSKYLVSGVLLVFEVLRIIVSCFLICCGLMFDECIDLR